MMTKYYGDGKGRYLSIDDFFKDVYIGRLDSNSYGDSVNLDFIPDLIKSIITSKEAEHYCDSEVECSEVILGSLHLSISTKEIIIYGDVDTSTFSPSDISLTMYYFDKFLDYFNYG